MPEISPQKVCFIIVKAREFDATEEVEDDDEGSNAADDGFRQILVSHANDPTEAELKAHIDNLNVDEKAELVALAWLGRGDYGVDDWDQAVADARDRHEGPTSIYLLGLPLLGDLLEEGLARFDLNCTEFSLGRL